MNIKEKKQEVKKEKKEHRTQQNFFGNFQNDAVVIKRQIAKTGRIGGVRVG